MELGGFLEYSAALQAISHHTVAHHQAVKSYLADLQNRPELPGDDE
jgi:hypothetical protein